MKLMKEILRELDFHHCYGEWISSDSKKIRCKVYKSNGSFCFSFSKNGGITYPTILKYWFAPKEPKEVIVVTLLTVLTKWV